MDKDNYDWLREVLANAPGFKFWACPHCPKSIVAWTGELATCQTCGATNSGGSIDG